MEENKRDINVAEIFGENVFNDTVMQERLPKKIYKELRRTIEEGKELDINTADVIAHEMKEWAIEMCIRDRYERQNTNLIMAQEKRAD